MTVIKLWLVLPLYTAAIDNVHQNSSGINLPKNASQDVCVNKKRIFPAAAGSDQKTKKKITVDATAYYTSCAIIILFMAVIFGCRSFRI